MSQAALRFLIFGLFALASLVGGYLSRRRNWLDEEVSRRVHFHTVTWAWSASSLISLWRLPLLGENLWLVIVEAMVVVIPALLIIPLAKAIGANRGQVGVMAVAAGVGNIGFTLGGYLCFALFEQHDQALAYTGTAAAVLALTMILALYPVANHFGELSSGESLGRLMIHSLLSPPALPLYAGATGLVLSAIAPFPDLLIDWYLVDVVLYVVCFGGYFGLGMRLRLGGGLVYWKYHLLLAVFAFGVTPLLTWMIGQLSNLSPAPMGDLAGQVMLVEAFMPTGVSCVILANVFHLDARLGPSLWLYNTVAFLILILPPILLWIA